MRYPYYCDKTVDDLMHWVIEEILLNGKHTKNSKGDASELGGVLLELDNPRARLSRSETRGKPLGCLGELCWYLSGSDHLDFIQYYLHRYASYADEGIIFGAYGPRLWNFKGQDQIRNVISLLRRNRDSRKAVIQLFDATDLVGEHRDIPCTSTLQFMIRDDRLYMFTNMRSNDAYIGLPHDIFSFTMLQEIMARTLSVELGSYKHAVGSLHVYDQNRDEAQSFLDEGFQETKNPMPAMPVGDPWPAIGVLLDCEQGLRTGAKSNCENETESLDPYWVDLIRLLQVFHYKKKNDESKIAGLRKKMSSRIYDPYINSMIERIKKKKS